MALSSHIKFNNKCRAIAIVEIEKDFLKLLHNSVYGKLMDNVRNLIDVKLVDNVRNVKTFLHNLKFGNIWRANLYFTRLKNL